MDRVALATTLFPKLLQARKLYRIRQGVMQHIFQLRNVYERDSINAISFPFEFKYVQKLPEHVKTVYLLDQRLLLERLHIQFGDETIEDLMKPTADDRIRLFAILLSGEFDEDLLLTRKRQIVMSLIILNYHQMQYLDVLVLPSIMMTNFMSTHLNGMMQLRNILIGGRLVLTTWRESD